MTAVLRRFEVTMPPSLNRLWRRNPHSKKPYLDPKYTSWARTAAWELREHGIHRLGTIDHRVAIVIILPEKQRGDGDNRFKALCDFLQRERVVDDDKLFRGHIALRSADVPKGRALVLIVELSAVLSLLALSERA